MARSIPHKYTKCDISIEMNNPNLDRIYNTRFKDAYRASFVSKQGETGILLTAYTPQGMAWINIDHQLCKQILADNGVKFSGFYN